MPTEYKGTRNLVFLDTETTGVGKEDRLVQLAYRDCRNSQINELFNPGIPIDPAASAVNHITNRHIEHAPVFKDSTICMQLQALLNEPDTVLVAHNAKFDIGMLSREEVTVPTFICTQKLWSFMDPGKKKLGKHNMQFLRYYYELDIEAQAHDALGDILVLEQVFLKALELFRKNMPDLDDDQIVEEMIAISKKITPLKVAPFGKHKKKPFNAIPADYLAWAIDNLDSEDFIYTAKLELERRREARRKPPA
jgi:DNA polymerase III epsilon subunit-like protein